MKQLAIRKQLLIAEAEVLRVRALEDLCVIRDGARSLRRQARSVSTIASTVALVVAGFTAVRRARTHGSHHGNGAHAGKSSLFSRVLTGARIATGLWSALKARKP